MHQSTTPSLSQTIWLKWAWRQFLNLPIVQTFLPVTFGYSLNSEAVVMRQLRRLRRSLKRSHKKTSMGPSSCWNGRSALQPEEITSKRTRVSCVYYQWNFPYEKSLETYLMVLVFRIWSFENISNLRLCFFFFLWELRITTSYGLSFKQIFIKSSCQKLCQWVFWNVSAMNVSAWKFGPGDFGCVLFSKTKKLTRCDLQ